MSRAERRNKERKPKGGPRVHITINCGHRAEPSMTPCIDAHTKIGNEIRKEKVLRSKQVPGF